MLPSAIAYQLPTASELPTDRATWSLAPERAALLVHDMQEHFIAAFAPDAEPIGPVRARIAALVAAARAAGIPVYYTAQPTHQPLEQRGLLTDLWGAGIGEDADAARIIPELTPADTDTVLTKWRYDAFERSDLRERLAAAGRDQLVVTGVYAHIGCQATALRAFMLDIQPFFVADAVADFSEVQHRASLDLVADCAGVTTTADAVLAALGADAGAPATAAASTTEAQPGIPADWEGLRAALAECTGTDAADITPDTELGSIGMDSVRMMELAEQFSTAEAEVGFTDLALCDTPEDLAAVLRRVHEVEIAGVGA